MKGETVNQRVRKVKEFYCKTNVEFANKLNISRQEAGNMMTDGYAVGVKKTTQITAAFPSIDPNWLLFGYGDMFLEGTEEYNAEILPNKDNSIIYNNSGIEFKEVTSSYFLMKVPTFPSYAHAKYMDEFKDVMSWDGAEFSYFPCKSIHRGKYMAFEIKGDSMDDGSINSIPNGYIVNARQLHYSHWQNKLHFNKFPYWIIITENSILCKQIIGHDIEKNIITCHSLNKSPEYNDFELNLDDVMYLFNIVQKMSGSI